MFAPSEERIGSCFLVAKQYFNRGTLVWDSEKWQRGVNIPGLADVYWWAGDEGGWENQPRSGEN